MSKASPSLYLEVLQHLQMVNVCFRAGVTSFTYYACATVFGTIISALFVEFADYRWIFWFTTILAIPAAILCIVLVPSQERPSEESRSAQRRVENLKKLDVVVVTDLTGGYFFPLLSRSRMLRLSQ